MVFSSMIFLCAFLPITFIAYRLLPSLRWKNVWLVIVSLFFYAYGEPVYVLLMIASALANYGFGICLKEENPHRKRWVVLTVVFNIGVLGIFKYTGFLVENVNLITGMKLPVPQITLPIGISFFTFQAMSYALDVYYGRTKPQKNFGKILLYISFFPQLIAGPIVKYHDVAQEIDDRKQTLLGVTEGIRRFIIGLSKKILIANTMGAAADYLFGLDAAGLSAAGAWTAAIAYALQIYFDFSGYSDMAIGLGWMFGFHFKENFQYPYYSDSIKDFWRRWHISLSTWFKEYLYIPLGGNRKGKGRARINRLIVFFCTGLWHGASWNFVLWGLLHGALMLIEDVSWWPLKKVKFRPIRQLYAVLMAVLAFVLFRAETLPQAGIMYRAMFTGGSSLALASANVWSIWTPMFLVVLVFGMVCAMPVNAWLKRYIPLKLQGALTYGISIILLALCVLQLSTASYNPFIYFRF